MDNSYATPQQGYRLIQIGLVMFVLSLLIGLVISRFAHGLGLFAVPRLGLAAHLIGLMQGTFLVAIGSIWPKLMFSALTSRLTFALLVYGFFAAWTANVLAGVWGAGGAMLPNAGGSAQGTAVQEMVIAVGLRTAAISQVLALLLLIWSTRNITRRG